RIREFRIDIYKVAGPLLNDIYAFQFHVGKWRELTPEMVVSKKRDLDALMYSHESLLSTEFFERYRRFMHEVFAPPEDWQHDVKLRSSTKCRPAKPNEDGAARQAWFSNEDNRDQICLAYRNLMGQLSEELLFQTLPKSDASEAEKIKQCPHYDFSQCA